MGGKKEPQRAADQDPQLPQEYLTADYLPPDNPRSPPVRGGKRRPDDDDYLVADSEAEVDSEGR